MFNEYGGSARVSGYVFGIVLFTYGEHPWSYALYRTLETVLGIAVAILVTLAPKLLTTGLLNPDS